MGKSRRLGFLDDQAADDAVFDLFARLRSARHPARPPSPPLDIPPAATL